MARPTVVLWALLVGLGWGVTARGHGDSVSTLRVTLRDRDVHVSLTLAFRDLSEWVPVGEGDYPAAVATEMRASAAQMIQVQYDERVVPPSRVAVSTATVGSVVIDWTYPAIDAAETVTVQSLHLDRLPPGHHQSFVAEDERATRGKHLQHALLANETLGREEPLAVVDVPRRVSPPTAAVPENAVQHAAPSSAGFLSTKSFRLLIAGVVVLICGGLLTLRSTLKTAGPRAASDPLGRTSCN